MLPVVKDKIPDNIAIPCPKIAFNKTQAVKACTVCPYYDGLALMSPNDTLPWYMRYAIRCTHPIERRVTFFK